MNSLGLSWPLTSSPTSLPGGVRIGGIFDRDQMGGRVVTLHTKECRRCLDTIPVQWFSDTCAECLLYTDLGGG